MTPPKLPVREGRGALTPRPVSVQRGVNPHAPGSAHLKMGRTEILATVTLDDKPAPHMRGKKEGWLTAEYSMLPRSTTDRQARERNLQNGRRHEIQRLLGRALRSSLDLRPFKNQTLYVDCDVLVADGGTRVASVLAGHAALHDFCDRLINSGQLSEWPMVHNVGAISVVLVVSPYIDANAAGKMIGEDAAIAISRFKSMNAMIVVRGTGNGQGISAK